ncbi:MAG: cysteine hydrolase family protein [Deltaproteobacteria bacterium]|jgi:nicotinamidase-related amidase|nr:cysteine hydrolase family protein [Deltaproteobacteria bacterium]
MNSALILIDIQNDYFPGGRMELTGADEAGKAAGRLLADFRRHGLPVVHVQHVSTREGAGFFLPGTEGVHFHQSVAPLEGETVIQKGFPNSFRSTELENVLQKDGIKQLVICGMMSHMCVSATVRAAFDLGYQCLVAHDACATRSLVFDGREIGADHVHAVSMAAMGGLFARVMKVDEVIERVFR